MSRFPASAFHSWPHRWLVLLAVLFLVLPGIAQKEASGAPDGSSVCPTPSTNEASLKALLRRTADVLRAQDEEQRNFAWHERRSQQQKSGGVSIHSRDETWDVSIVDGEEYKRLIARGGHPLSPEEAQKQQQKLQKFIEKHEPESADERSELEQKRRKDSEREQRRQAALLQDFHFALTGTRSTPWGNAWVVHATPIPGLRLTDKDARMMTHFAGDLWIESSGCHLLRLDLRILDPIAFGWVLGKVDQGGHLVITFAPVDSGHWFPREFSLEAQGRILFKHLDVSFHNDYFDYRRFQAETSIQPAVPVSDPPPQK